MTDRKRKKPNARISWAEAKAYYLALGPERSYGSVAERFRCSTRAVELHGARGSWKDEAAAVDAQAEAATTAATGEYVLRSLELRRRDTYRLIDAAREKAIAGLVADQLDVRLSDLPALLKVEQLMDGEATERVDYGEHRSQLRQVVVVLLDLVPVEQRAVALERLRGLRGLDAPASGPGAAA